MRWSEIAGPLDERLHTTRGLRTEFATRKEFTDYIAQQGFEQVGMGEFGAVLDHPSFGQRYVLKVFSDRCYEGFVEYCMKHAGNPHLPRFIGRIMRLSPKARMVRMERLEEIDSFEPFSWNKMCQWVEKRRQSKRESPLPDVADSEQALLDTLVDVVRHTPTGCFNDIHHNIMRRGHTVVITDPHASEEWIW